MRSLAVGHVALASSVLLALVVAACGEGGQAPGPQVPAGPPASVAPESTAPAPAPVGVPTAPPGSAPAATDAPPPAAPMKAIGPSAFADDLRKLGIDPLKPPPLNKLSPDVIRKLMPSFSKSLGVKCEFCHDNNDFKASTPHKRVAANMWQHFVVDLALEDGSPLYCDSCHGGKAEFLDTHDKKTLSAWMDTNYVGKLKRADKKEHSCETCHGDPFEPKLLRPWHK